MKLYPKSKRSSFPYWFAHWWAFNKTAWSLNLWKPKWLLHDIEKPWLMFIWRDYPRVKKWHRFHNAHHFQYPGPPDWIGMVIDWECSRFSKLEAQLTALETLPREIEKYIKTDYQKTYQMFKETSKIMFQYNLINKYTIIEELKNKYFPNEQD